jgi:C-terminal processing protease CtpA/Prc
VILGFFLVAGAETLPCVVLLTSDLEFGFETATEARARLRILSRERSCRGDSLRPVPAGSTGKDYFFYSKPIVVLSNAGSFSAADGFLNAFADLPQVTIVGEPSGGGSGATRQFQLPKTGLVIALSSMASFRPNGKLFDGHGIEVDIAVKPPVEDYTTDSDSVLARGIGVINEKARSEE